QANLANITLATGAGSYAKTESPSSKIIAPCPYRGLFAFREEDTRFFFGREEFTAKLVDIVDQQYLIPVIGPSGSGKSSVIFAGLVPQLRQQADWIICQFRPGVQPFTSLAAALLPSLDPKMSEIDRLVETRRFAQQLEHQITHLNSIINRILEKHDYINHVLIVIDQFEEIYTLCGNADMRKRFLDLLTAVHVSDTFRIVLSLRADFLGQALTHPRFASIIQNTPLILGPMYRDELTNVVERPAEIQGVKFEAGLVDRIIDDVGFESGNLPLLEFALTSLWGKQERGVLTHKAYDEIGRVEGALARHAETIYSALTNEEKELTRSVMIQMVRPGDNTEDTRRLTTRQEMGEERWELVSRLADARLIVTNRDPEENETAEVVHEALIRSWERLRTWMDADRSFRLWQERLRASLYQWEDNEQDIGALLRGATLTEAEEWLQQREQSLNEAEQNYIIASIEQRNKTQADQARMRRRVVAGLVSGLAVTIILTIIAFLQLNNALAARAEAESERDQARMSLSRQLSIQSLSLLDEQIDLALLLGVAAENTADTFDARQTLLTGIATNPRLRTILRSPEELPRHIAYSEDGLLYISSGIEGEVILRDAQTLEIVDRLDSYAGPIRDIDISPQGQYVAVATGDGVLVWDTSTLTQIAELQREENPPEATLAFSGDNTSLAVGYADGLIIVWDVASGAPLYELAGHKQQITDMEFSRDGRLLASGSLDRTAIIWDIRLREPYVEPITGHSGIVWAVAFHPDSTRLATGSADGTIEVWNTSSGLKNRNTLRNPSGEWITSLDYNNDGLLLASGTRDHNIIIWDTIREQIDVDLETLHGHKGIVWDVVFSDNGTQMASISEDNQFIIWNTERQPRVGPITRAPLEEHEDRVRSLAYLQDGQTLVSGDEGGALIFWDLTTNPPTGRPFYSGTAVNVVAYSQDEQIIASGGANGNIVLWDTELRRPLGSPLQKHTNIVTSLVFSPDSKLLASGSQDGTIVLWDLLTREPLNLTINGDGDAILTLVFTPNGERLLAGDTDGHIIIWDVNTGAQISEGFEAHLSAITTLVFSPNNELLASAGEDRAIFLWDAADFEAYKTGDPLPQPLGDPLSGHERRINALTFSPDSRILASGSTGTAYRNGDIGNGDDIIILWDVASKRPLGPPLQSRHGRVFALAFSPDGDTLASGGWDNSVLLWDTNPAMWQEIACWRANREFTVEEWDRYLGIGTQEPICQTNS
ncbi:MAG: hypothetical protein KDE51_04390, partial [Anaerolineales bacterium]|nr:hypothetical protein [Anaerolineales bacterium]